MFGREVRASEVHVGTIGRVAPCPAELAHSQASYKLQGPMQRVLDGFLVRNTVQVHLVEWKPNSVLYAQISCRHIFFHLSNIIQVHARQEQSGDTRRRVCVAKSQLFITPFVCIQSYTCLHHLYTGVGNHMLLLSPRNLSTPSYVPNMMAALGTTRNM